MKPLIGNEDAYGNQYNKQLLKEKYGSGITIVLRDEGKVELITFESTFHQVMENQFVGIQCRTNTSSQQ